MRSDRDTRMGRFGIKGCPCQWVRKQYIFWLLELGSFLFFLLFSATAKFLSICQLKLLFVFTPAVSQLIYEAVEQVQYCTEWVMWVISSALDWQICTRITTTNLMNNTQVYPV